MIVKDLWFWTLREGTMRNDGQWNIIITHNDYSTQLKVRKNKIQQNVFNINEDHCLQLEQEFWLKVIRSHMLLHKVPYVSKRHPVQSTETWTHYILQISLPWISSVCCSLGQCQTPTTKCKVLASLKSLTLHMNLLSSPSHSIWLYVLKYPGKLDIPFQ